MMRNDLCLLFLRGRKSHSFSSSELCLLWDHFHGPMQCHIMKNWDIKTRVDVNYSQFKIKWLLKKGGCKLKCALQKISEKLGISVSPLYRHIKSTYSTVTVCQWIHEQEKKTANSFLWLLDPKDEGIMVLQSMGNCVLNSIVLHPRECESWKHEKVQLVLVD